MLRTLGAGVPPRGYNDVRRVCGSRSIMIDQKDLGVWAGFLLDHSLGGITRRRPGDDQGRSGVLAPDGGFGKKGDRRPVVCPTSTSCRPTTNAGGCGRRRWHGTGNEEQLGAVPDLARRSLREHDQVCGGPRRRRSRISSWGLRPSSRRRWRRPTAHSPTSGFRGRG